jgi:hypothetical protein
MTAQRHIDKEEALVPESYTNLSVSAVYEYRTPRLKDGTNGNQKIANHKEGFGH